MLSVAGAVLAVTLAAPVPDLYPKAETDAYLLLVDGVPVSGRDVDVPRPPASLVKLMTALVATGEGWDPSAVVTVSKRTASEGGATLPLEEGDRMLAGDLLTAMLVRSANDAAVAIAEARAGSVEKFVEAMNARAKTLGLTATHFVNPNGRDAAGQTSSARDLAILAEEAMKNPEIARIVALKKASVKSLGGTRYKLESSNQFLGRLAGTTGIKTGFTDGAGKCVIALVERGPRRVLLVLLGCPDRWWTGQAIIENAFDAADKRA
jgi:D-alanyl-D-alanine carboxypeptidase (penicillin-binding protein 5/6)